MRPSAAGAIDIGVVSDYLIVIGLFMGIETHYLPILSLWRTRSLF